VIASQSRQANFSRTRSMTCPSARLAFQCLRHRLAEFAQPRAAALAAHARRGFEDAFDRKVLRQLARPALRAPARRFGAQRRRNLGARLLLRLRLFQILNCEFELLDEQLASFRRLTEALMAGLRQLQLQPLDLQSAGFGLACGFAQRRLSLRQHLALREDHRVRARQIAAKPGQQAVGRMFGRSRHNQTSADSTRKVAAKLPGESIRRSHPAAVGRQVFCGVRQSIPDKR